MAKQAAMREDPTAIDTRPDALDVAQIFGEKKNASHRKRSRQRLALLLATVSTLLIALTVGLYRSGPSTPSDPLLIAGWVPDGYGKPVLLQLLTQSQEAKPLSGSKIILSRQSDGEVTVELRTVPATDPVQPDVAPLSSDDPVDRRPFGGPVDVSDTATKRLARPGLALVLTKPWSSWINGRTETKRPTRARRTQRRPEPKSHRVGMARMSSGVGESKSRHSRHHRTSPKCYVRLVFWMTAN